MSHEEQVLLQLAGVLVLGIGATYDTLDQRFGDGYVVKTTKLSPEFDWAAFKQRHGEDALPLFVVTETGQLLVCAADKPPAPKPGQTVISLVKPVERSAPAAGAADAAGRSGVAS